jgi:hypothetical protein
MVSNTKPIMLSEVAVADFKALAVTVYCSKYMLTA